MSERNRRKQLIGMVANNTGLETTKIKTLTWLFKVAMKSGTIRNTRRAGTSDRTAIRASRGNSKANTTRTLTIQNALTTKRRRGLLRCGGRIG